MLAALFICALAAGCGRDGAQAGGAAGSSSGLGEGSPSSFCESSSISAASEEDACSGVSSVGQQVLSDTSAGQTADRNTVPPASSSEASSGPETADSLSNQGAPYFLDNQTAYSVTLPSGITVDNPCQTDYGAANQQQYDVISQGAEKAISHFKSDIEAFKAKKPPEAFQKKFHVTMEDELALRAIMAYSYAATMGKGLGSDGMNAYNVFAGVPGKDPWKFGSQARAAEAICHKLGVNCKVAVCSQTGAAWIYVLLSDGKWYHYDGSGTGFVTDPEQITENGSDCEIYY